MHKISGMGSFGTRNIRLDFGADPNPDLEVSFTLFNISKQSRMYRKVSATYFSHVITPRRHSHVVSRAVELTH